LQNNWQESFTAKKLFIKIYDINRIVSLNVNSVFGVFIIIKRTFDKDKEVYKNVQL